VLQQWGIALMKVYHGSYTAIEKVDLSLGGKQKDFGRGFYVTNLREQAETWATRIGSLKRGVGGVVTEFEYSEFMARDMKMKILKFDYYTDEWLDFVVLNRQNISDTSAHDYDIVEGPVADDRVTRQVSRFMAGKISREQFMADLVHNPSHQICFCTTQSLQALSPPKEQIWINFDIEDIGEAIVQALMSDYGLTEDAAIDMFYTSAAYAAVADESTGYYKKPWSEIYAMLQDELKI
jgi:hypothetical protein